MPAPDHTTFVAIRWIAFDAVGTLIYPDPPVAVAYHRIARRCGSRLTEEEIAERFGRAFRRDETTETLSADNWRRRDALRTSETHEFERWQRIVGEVIDDVDRPAACFRVLYAHFARPDSWRCFDDTAETLQALDRAGYRLAIASNFDLRLKAIRDGLPELQPIAELAVSSLVGYRKPSLWFYRSLSAAVGAEPHEILMVGDDFTNDVEGARAAGLAAVPLSRKNGDGRETIGSLRELPKRLKA